jgi:hypothetical protein
VALGEMRRSPALGHVLIQKPLYPSIESDLLLVEFVGRKFDFNKKEAILMVNHKQVGRLRMGSANEFRSLDT